jgi:hypothetical protein
MRLSVALLPLLLVGCATSTYAIPKSHIVAPYASIGAAEQAGVAQVPGPATRLEYARRELMQANALLKQGEGRQADLMYLRADADARTATALARAEMATAETKRMRDDAQQAGRQVEDLCRAAAPQSQ